MFAEPEWAFPFMGMEPGDSFCIPTNNPDYMKQAIKKAAKNYGIDVLVRTRVEEGVLVVRCWLVKSNDDE
jgi:hypothetical protein